MKTPVLITGSHRSGKGYTINAINLNKSFNIIQEPLNIDSRIGWTGIDIPYYFTYINEKNSAYFKEKIINTIYNYDYRLSRQLKNIAGLREFLSVLKDFARSFKYKLNNKRPLIDDPFAIFSAEWFYKEINVDIIIMIRHPASFISSLKLLNYDFPFSHLFNQKKLIEGPLHKYALEIEEFTNKKKSIVEQGVLLWRMIYDVVCQYRKNYSSDWLFIRFEDVVRNPEIHLKEIYKYTGLSADNINFKTLKIDLSKNFSKEDKEVKLLLKENKINDKYSIEDHLNCYKIILTDSEIQYIKETARGVWMEYYTEDEWI